MNSITARKRIVVKIFGMNSKLRYYGVTLIRCRQLTVTTNYAGKWNF